MNVDFRIPEIETERLRLRLPRLTDLKVHAAFRAGPRSKWVGGPFDHASSFHHLAGVIGQWQLRGYGRWIAADRATDAPLGLVGIYHPEDWPEPEIGWSLYDGAEGRGYALEAALATRDFAYRVLGWSRIVSLVMPGNTRSERLAEKMGAVRSSRFEHPVLGPLDVWVHVPPGDTDAIPTSYRRDAEADLPAIGDHA